MDTKHKTIFLIFFLSSRPNLVENLWEEVAMCPQICRDESELEENKMGAVSPHLETLIDVVVTVRLVDQLQSLAGYH